MVLLTNKKIIKRRKQQKERNQNKKKLTLFSALSHGWFTMEDDDDEDEEVEAAAAEVEALKCSCVSISDNAVSNCSCLMAGINGKKSLLLKLESSSSSMLKTGCWYERRLSNKD